MESFCPDSGPEREDVIHLRDLPELLWPVAGFPGIEVADYKQRCLELSRGLFEVLGVTDHWLYRPLPGRLGDRCQLVAAATQASSGRVTRALCSLWEWRDRLIASAEPWAELMMCRHPVRRGNTSTQDVPPPCLALRQ